MTRCENITEAGGRKKSRRGRGGDMRVRFEDMHYFVFSNGTALQRKANSTTWCY